MRHERIRRFTSALLLVGVISLLGAPALQAAPIGDQIESPRIEQPGFFGWFFGLLGDFGDWLRAQTGAEMEIDGVQASTGAEMEIDG